MVRSFFLLSKPIISIPHSPAAPLPVPRPPSTKNTHQHSDGPHQHTQPSAQRAAEHQPGAERKQRARNEANGGEHIHSGEGDGAQSRVVFNPLQEALENVGDETQSGNLPVGNKENKDTAVNWSVYVDEDR